MSYVGNMPADWQQYSALQSGEAERQQQQQQQQQHPHQQQQQQQQTTTTSSSNSSSSNASNSANLYNLDCLSKQQQQPQNEGYYTSPSTRLHHHHVGPYAMEATVGDELQQQQQQQQQQHHQRQVQMQPMNSPNAGSTRIAPTTMTVNSAMGSVSQMMPGPIQPAASVSAASNRQSSYACKGPCCQAVTYRWDKMSPFAPSNAYPPAASPYSSRYRPDLYAQQQQQPPPPPSQQHQQQQQQQQHQQAAVGAAQQQQQRRYRSKEPSQIPRGYQQPGSYPGMQPYNYPPTDYHQKYYARPMAAPQPQNPMINPAAMPAAMQDKYLTSKQQQYQTTMQNGVMMTNPAALPPSALNSPYYNHQMARDLPGEYSCKPPDPKDQVPPSMTTLQTKHIFQQKLQNLAIQRLNLEKHLREFSHLVGYQNYPKYQELVMKHRDVVRMQQSLEHQSSMQSAAVTAPVPSTIPPINLQFDQNGVLINSSLMTAYSHNVPPSMPVMPNPLSPGKEPTRNPYDNKAMQAMEHALQQQQQHQPPHQQSHPQAQPQPPTAHQMPQHAMMQPSPEQHHPHYIPQEYHHQVMHQQHHHPHHPPPQHPIDDDVVSVEAAAAAAAAHQKTSKDFADKPELDVRQFLATWAETEEDDGVNGGLQNVILTEDTPIVVLEYNENLNLATANNLTAQAICVSAAAEKEAAVSAAASLSKDQISTANESNAEQQQQQQQSIPATVNIIHCITSTGEVCDEVPTIHIVDTLENEAVVKKIEGALHSLNPTDIKSIEEIVNKNNNANSQAHVAKEVSLEFLTTAATAASAATTSTVSTAVLHAKEPQQKNAEETNAVVATTSTSVEQPAATAAIEKKVETPEKVSSDNNNLANFVSEDTRNQDDLSLPELPTSECTTTLNTPNQSDNEESSSERVRALNNISPIISFAHSPIKFQKSGDDLHFDFQSSNEATVLKDASAAPTQSSVDKETTDKGTSEPKSQVLPETEIAVSTPSTQTQEQQVASVIDSFEFAEFSNSSTLPLGDEPKMPVPPMEGNCLTKIMKDTPPITNLRVLDSDDELADKVNDIWMDINLDNALCNSVNKLLEEKQVQTKRKSSLRHVRKHKNNNVSVVEKPVNTDEKSNDDRTTEEVVCSDREDPQQKERVPRKSLDSTLKNIRLERPKKRARSMEVDYNSSQDQEDLLKEFKSLKRKRSIGQLQDDIEMLKSSIHELKNHNANNLVPVTENNGCKDASLPMLPDTKVAEPPKRRFSSIFDPDTALVKPAEELNSKNCVDSNIKIQLPNVNLQIQDKQETANNVCSTNSTNEGIKIEINVSRVESQRNSNDNEIVSKSNQHLNISLPPASPVSCKVDCRASITAVEDEIATRALPAKETIEEKSSAPIKDKLMTKETKEDDNIIAFENKNAEIEDSKCLIIENKDNSLLKKKEIDIENAMKKLEEAKEDCFRNKTFVEAPGCSKDFDFDNFDVEPFDDKSDDYLKDLLGRKSNSVGYLNPLFHLDELENLNNVPVYTTKDGKITYSPNPNYTYRALIIEARQREGHALFRDFYNKRSKHLSRHRHKRERETLSFENCLANDLGDKSDNDDKKEIIVRSTILDRTDKEKSGIRLSPVPSTPPSMVFESSRSMPLLDDDTSRCMSPSNSKSSMNRCIVDLQNLKDDILKKLNDQPSSIFNVQMNKDEDNKMEDKNSDNVITKVNEEHNAVEENDKPELGPDDLQKNVPDNDDLRKTECDMDDSAVDGDSGAVICEMPTNEEKIEETVASEVHGPFEENIDEKEIIVSKSIESNKDELDDSAKEIESLQETANTIKEINHIKDDEQNKNEKESSKILKVTQDETSEVAIPEHEVTNFEEKKEKIEEFIDLTGVSSDDNDSKSNQSEQITADIVESNKPEDKLKESIELAKPIETEPPKLLVVVQKEIMIQGSPTRPKVKTPEHTSTTETAIKPIEHATNNELSVKTPEHVTNVKQTVKTPEHAPTVEPTIEMPELTPITEPTIKMPELTRIVKPTIKTPEHLSSVESDKDKALELESIPKLKAAPHKEETTVSSPQQKPNSSPKSLNISLPCSIDKSSFSSELCDSFINQEKLHAIQARTIPKLVIRKTDANPKFFSKSKSIDTSILDDSKKEESVKSPVHPKIPKMIIRNAKSRPTTPSIEEISESSDSESKPLLMRLKREDPSETKIPKMKIKLEEKQPRVVIENIIPDQKTIPKMKITNVKSCQPKIMDTEDDSSDSDKRSKIKRSSSAATPQSKKAKRSPKDEVQLDPNLEDTQFLLENEYRQRNNSSSSSKVPKVIIKRTSPTAEFKCELSKDAIVNSQPKVVLNRSWVLDCMAKDLRHMKVVVKVSSDGKEKVKKEEKTSPNELQWRRFISGLKKRRELSRSNSTPDLHQVSPKIKRRRTSDYCLDSNFDYSDSNSSTRFTFARTRSDTEAELPKTDALDENMNSRSKMDMEEPPPRLETIIEASNSYSSEYLATELLDRDVDVHEEEVDFESSVIKVDSSDESETTIEILAASPDLSFGKDVVDEGQIYSEDAVPMQFEYEVEIGENTPDPMDVPLPSSDTGTDKSSSIEVKQIPGILINDQLAIEDTSGNTSVGEEVVPAITSSVEVVDLSKSSESSHTPATPASEVVENSLSKSSNSCPAAEAADNSLSKSSSDQVLLNDEASSTSTLLNNENANSREPAMTEEEDSNAAGASCSSSDLLVKEVLAAKEMLKKYLGCLTTSSADSPEKEQASSFKPKHTRSIGSSPNFRHSEKRKKLSRIKSRSNDSHSLRTSSSSRHPSSNNRLSSSRPTSKHRDNELIDSRSHQIKYKSTKLSSQTANVDPLTRAVEENLRHSKQREKPDNPIDESPKRLDNVISRLDEANLKAKVLQLSPEMTISSIVRELVFHEKATIRHRRYCMLCERWFPTTLRHRRHLAGYQHRHTELTQRRAIHMLFLIFTGKLCPKLLPPNVVRTDCVPGELTPLQIAVQDFATVFDGIKQVTVKQEDENKK